MTREKLREYIIDSVKCINSATDEREKLYNKFHSKLSDELDGVDHMEYSNGCVYNTYINFDSCCGLSMVEVSAELEQIVHYINDRVKKYCYTLEDIINIISDIGDRKEYWTDLVDDENGYKFIDNPETIADTLLSVLDEWKGEKDFTKDLKEVLDDKG